MSSPETNSPSPSRMPEPDMYGDISHSNLHLGHAVQQDSGHDGNVHVELNKQQARNTTAGKAAQADQPAALQATPPSQVSAAMAPMPQGTPLPPNHPYRQAAPTDSEIQAHRKVFQKDAERRVTQARADLEGREVNLQQPPDSETKARARIIKGEAKRSLSYNEPESDYETDMESDEEAEVEGYANEEDDDDDDDDDDEPAHQTKVTPPPPAASKPKPKPLDLVQSNTRSPGKHVRFSPPQSSSRHPEGGPVPANTPINQPSTPWWPATVPPSQLPRASRSDIGPISKRRPSNSRPVTAHLGEDGEQGVTFIAQRFPDVSPGSAPKSGLSGLQGPEPSGNSRPLGAHRAADTWDQGDADADRDVPETLIREMYPPNPFSPGVNPNPPIEARVKNQTSARVSVAPQISTAVLTPTEALRLQKENFRLLQQRTHRLQQCPFDDCPFVSPMDLREEQSFWRSHLEEEHFPRAGDVPERAPSPVHCPYCKADVGTGARSAVAHMAKCSKLPRRSPEQPQPTPTKAPINPFTGVAATSDRRGVADKESQTLEAELEKYQKRGEQQLADISRLTRRLDEEELTVQRLKDEQVRLLQDLNKLREYKSQREQAEFAAATTPAVTAKEIASSGAGPSKASSKRKHDSGTAPKSSHKRQRTAEDGAYKPNQHSDDDDSDGEDVDDQDTANALAEIAEAGAPRSSDNKGKGKAKSLADPSYRPSGDSEDENDHDLDSPTVVRHQSATPATKERAHGGTAGIEAGASAAGKRRKSEEPLSSEAPKTKKRAAAPASMKPPPGPPAAAKKSAVKKSAVKTPGKKNVPPKKKEPARKDPQQSQGAAEAPSTGLRHSTRTRKPVRRFDQEQQ